LDKIEALLGSRISEARMAIGFSEKQLAQRLGLKEQSIVATKATNHQDITCSTVGLTG